MAHEHIKFIEGPEAEYYLDMIQKGKYDQAIEEVSSKYDKGEGHRIDSYLIGHYKFIEKGEYILVYAHDYGYIHLIKQSNYENI